MEDDDLKQEWECYQSKLAELLRDSRGKYVLIHGDTVEGVFDQEEDAFEVAYDKFGPGPFLIKRVTDVEPVLHLGWGVVPCTFEQSRD